MDKHSQVKPPTPETMRVAYQYAGAKIHDLLRRRGFEVQSMTKTQQVASAIGLDPRLDRKALNVLAQSTSPYAAQAALELKVAPRA